MEFEKPINIQLFAESEDSADTETSQKQVDDASTKQSDTKNTVSKDLFDKTASEVAELKKQLRELQKTGKSEAELRELDIKEKDAELQKRNEELHKLYVELNRANAKSILAETQAKIGLTDASAFDNIVDAIVVDNGDITKSRATELNKLLVSVYEKAISDVKSNQWSDMSKNIKTNGISTNTNDKNRIDFIKSLNSNNVDVSSIKDKFKL